MLKHRAEKDTRPVPVHPEPVVIINRHVERFGFGPGGRLFTGPYGGLIDESTYLPIWQRARAAVLTTTEPESPLAKRPYDRGIRSARGSTLACPRRRSQSRPATASPSC